MVKQILYGNQIGLPADEIFAVYKCSSTENRDTEDQIIFLGCKSIAVNISGKQFYVLDSCIYD